MDCPKDLAIVMSQSKTPLFRVSSIGEEYAIIQRMVCPTCQSQLRLDLQKAISGSDGRIKGDLLTLKCANTTCDYQIEVVFYLPEDYDPLARYKR